MLQRTRCPVLAHRVILLRLIGRYWRRGGPSASRTQQNAGGLIDVRVLFRPPVEPNPHERVSASHTERQFRAWEVVGR